VKHSLLHGASDRLQASNRFQTFGPNSPSNFLRGRCSLTFSSMRAAGLSPSREPKVAISRAWPFRIASHGFGYSCPLAALQADPSSVGAT
jgi:hypothetical protein